VVKVAERRIVIDNLVLQYEGLFDVRELYLMIDKWLRQKGYDKFEKRNYEHVLKDGKYIEIELEPWKKFTDYAKIVINMYIHMHNVKEVVVKKDNVDVKMNQGRIRIRFIGFLVTDYMHKWEGKPVYYLLRAMMDKWVYRVTTDKFESAVSDDVKHLYQNIKAFLNLYRY
jgi:hypothetical protein